ncbi:hypothetical protein ACFY9A_17435 [Streptomyces rubradiris]|uniref:hypothetical protein n=1 Tax=Streptomyces rubradiris TaxID=285531 RepID=UPI0036E20BA6
MTTIAVTDHMDLPEDTVPLVRTALDDDSDLVGVSCTAKGAGSLFAEAVLATVGHPSRTQNM